MHGISQTGICKTCCGVLRVIYSARCSVTTSMPTSPRWHFWLIHDGRSRQFSYSINPSSHGVIITTLPVPHPLISCICSSSANLQLHISSRLWLVLCQIMFCNMRDYPALSSCLPATLPVPDLRSKPFSPNYLPALDKLFPPFSWKTYLPSNIGYRTVCTSILLLFLPAMDVSPLLSTNDQIGMSGTLPACGLLQLLA